MRSLAWALWVVCFGGSFGTSQATAQECEPSLISKIRSSASVIEVRGNLAFVGNFSGLLVFDVSAPATPVMIGSMGIPGMGGELAVMDDIVLQHCQDQDTRATCLLVVDVSDPRRPSMITSVEIPVFNVDTEGSLAFAVVRSELVSGVQILDLADPGKPELLGFVEIGSRPNKISVHEGFAYVGNSTGLRIVDVRDAMNPVVVGGDDSICPLEECEPGRAVYDIEIAGNIAYIAGGEAGLLVYDVSDPSDPRLVNTIEAVRPRRVAVSDDLVFVSGADGFDVIRDGDIIGSVDAFGSLGVDDLERPVVFATGGRVGLASIDVSVPSKPAILASFRLPGEVWGVAGVGDAVFITDIESGLFTVDASNPMSPVVLGHTATPGEANHVVVSDGVAYVGDGLEGMQLIDVRDLRAPRVVGSIGTPSRVTGIEVVGNLAFVSDRAGGLLAVDVTDATAPTLIGALDTPGIASDVAVLDAMAYVADGSSLRIIDIGDPSAMTLVATVDVVATKVVVSGGIAYVLDGHRDVLVIDVTEARDPIILGVVAATEDPEDITFVDGFVHVASGEFGYGLIDVRDPTSPVVVGTIELGGQARTVAVSQGLAFVADRGHGLKILDTSSCTACEADLTGSSDPDDDTYGVPDGDADGDDFFFFLDLFAAGDSRADFDNDGDLDGDDLFAYLDVFSIGC